jgi:transposase InsO family protein
VRSPQTNGVIERFFGTLKYEHLYRAPIGNGNALAVEVNLFRHTPDASERDWLSASSPSRVPSMIFVVTPWPACLTTAVC